MGSPFCIGPTCCPCDPSLYCSGYNCCPCNPSPTCQPIGGNCCPRAEFPREECYEVCEFVGGGNSGYYGGKGGKGGYYGGSSSSSFGYEVCEVICEPVRGRNFLYVE